MKPNLTLKFFSVLLVAAFLFTAVMPVEAAAPYGGRIGVRAFPSFEKFVSTVTNGQTGVVRGVYVSDVLALRVVQQPAGPAHSVRAHDQAPAAGARHGPGRALRPHRWGADARHS